MMDGKLRSLGSNLNVNVSQYGESFSPFTFFFSGRFFLLVELKFDGWYTLILSLSFAIGPTVKSAEKRSV